MRPTSENFLKDFGPSSPAFRLASSLWLEAIATLGKQRHFQAVYKNWRKYLSIAYGKSSGDEELFVRHTYLATLAKLIAYLCITGARTLPSEAQTQEIIQGTFFKKQQIMNFLEEDFFSWAARAPVMQCSQKITSSLVRLLLTYRLRELSEDVLKELYLALVDPKGRHDLGEYYTPDWLAARMCNALLSNSGQDTVLDPACGSGTFLYQAIQHKKKHLPATRESLERILGSMVGIDIHPLAVIVAKMNVLLALGDLLQKRSRPLSVQVYLANSIRPAGARHGVPLHRQFDVVIGNPPWLSFRFVEEGEYQAYLKHLIVKEFGLLEGAGHLITHLELATLFFARCATLYLKRSGKIGFVLPRSIFSADQHHRFRRSRGMGGTTLTEVWDLEDVSPLFNVPAAVAFGDLISDPSKTLRGEILSGRLKRKNASLEEANRDLKAETAEFHVVQQGKRSFLSASRMKISSQRSFYQPYFKEGATIVPRSFWFVEFKAIPGPGRQITQFLVATDPRAQAEAKMAYKAVHFEAPIEAEFIYATLLSTDLLPFGHLDFRPVVLPLIVEAAGYRLLSAEQACAEGHMRLREWLERAQATWAEMRKEKAKKADALTWLNYRGKLTEQDPKGRYAVLYSRSATFLCAAALRTKALSYRVGGQEVALQHFVAVDATYSFQTNNRREAAFLVAILNSPTVDMLIKPMQARGLWGPRDIHKKVWEFPIPEFDPKDKAHLRLAEIAEACAEIVRGMVPGLKRLFRDLRGPHAIGRGRSAVREALKDELDEIDALVKDVLK
jgi:methylase of polypeptide subunit release factors